MKTSSLLILAFGFVITCSAQLSANLTSMGMISRYRCWGRSFGWTRNGSPWDCAQAVLMRFPTDIHLGLFHNSEQLDLYRLPITSNYGDCKIILELASDGPVEGRWPDVWTIAQTLNTACTYYRNDNPGSGVTGGEIYGGQNNKLKLTMMRNLVDDGNESGVATQ